MIKNNILRYFVISALLLSSLIIVQNHVSAAVLPDLGTAIDFGVLAATTITNVGNTVINGDLGLSPGTSVTGFPPGVVNGATHINNATAAQAQANAETAFDTLDQTCDNFAPWPAGSPPTSVQLNGLTLGPGVYCSGDTMNLAGGGTLILDGAGVYIFKAGSALTTVSDSNVVLTNGATAENVFWRIGSSATLAAPSGPGTSPTAFQGTVIALTDIFQTGGTADTILDIDGRLIALNGAVTFASPTIVTVPVDVTEPTLVITSDPTSPSDSTSSLEFTFEFSEGVTGFTVDDITLDFAGAGAAAVDGSNFTIIDANTYTLTLAGQDLTDLQALTSDQTVVVSVDMTGLTSIATSNSGSGTEAFTWTFEDPTVPTLVITSDPTSPSDSTSSLEFTFEFSEDVTGFEPDDITLDFAGAGAAAVDGSNFTIIDANTYTLTLAGQDLTDLQALTSGQTVVVSVDMTGLSSIATSNPGSGTEAFTWTFVTVPDSNGSSSKEWATKPTFGVSYNTDEQFVTDGFGYNVFTKTITDNFHTEFSMADIPTDTNYPLYAKGYFANQLKIQEFCFGIPETGKGYLAESCIEVHFDFGFGSDRKITDIKVMPNSNAIDDVSVQHEMASCNATDTVKVCDKTMITIAFAEPLQHSVMMIKGIDWTGRSTETYLNEGFNIAGKQLTDLPTTMIPPTTKYEGLIKVTQSEKYSDIWISDDKRVFERNSYGSFNQINQTYERHQDTGDVKSRTHSAFAEWKNYQAIKAKYIWDASKYVSTLAPSFTYDYPIEDHRTTFLKEHNMLEFARGQ